jgi:DNA-binding XRE family transcriptional regulator
MTMAKTLEEVLARLPEAERRAVEAEAAEIIQREMTLRDMRKARDLTQKTMATLMGVSQESISQLEQRSDALISTLSSYVSAMGGTLKLTAEFPEREPVIIKSFSLLATDAPPVPMTGTPTRGSKKRATGEAVRRSPSRPRGRRPAAG